MLETNRRATPNRPGSVGAWRGLSLVLAAAVTAAGPARADNPKINLKLQNAAPGEVVARLAEAANVKLDLYAPHLPQGGETASFDWTNVTFARALREFCQKYNLRPNRNPAGYSLFPSGAAPAAPAPKPVGAWEKDGIRLSVKSISTVERRTTNFVGDGPGWNDSGLSLQLAGELGELDTDTIAGVENLSARDDLGNMVVSNQTPTYYGNYYGYQYPDEWSGNASLSLPHPKAKKLQWVQGDLMAYRTVRPLRVEIPVPLEPKGARRQVGDWLIAVSRYEASHVEPEDHDEGLPQLGQRRRQSGPRLRVRVFYPAGRSSIASRMPTGYIPALVDAAGKSYSPTFSSGRGAGDGQMTMTDYDVIYPVPQAAPAKLVWDVVEKRDPYKLFTFKLADIPLPQAEPFVPRTAPPPPPPVTPGGLPQVQHPFYERGGGGMSFKLPVPAGKSGSGNLEVGLAAKSGTGWGPIRWTDVPVDARGTAALDDVKPGQYRVVAIYRPEESTGGAESPDGAATKIQAVVTVTAGKIVTLSGAAPAARPAPKKPVSRPAPRK